MTPSRRCAATVLLVGLAAVCAPRAALAAAPDVTVTSPVGGSTITSWTPAVSWGDAAVCKYSYDGSTFTDVDCAGDGSDISAPAPGTVNLYLRGDSSDDLETAYWATFTYDPPPTLGWNSEP